MIILTMCTEHARLVARLTSEKDGEMNSRLEQLQQQTDARIQQLQQQHSDMINALNTGKIYTGIVGRLKPGFHYPS